MPAQAQGSTSSNVPRNILAFRTITMLLSQIRRKQDSAVEPTSTERNKEEHREAKISDAFAHLAVAEFEVIALATKRSPEELGVMVCAGLSSNEETPNTPLRPWLPKPISAFGECIVTKNFCRDDDETKDNAEATLIRSVSTALPTIVSPTPPPGVEDTMDIEVYLTKLEKCWSQPNLFSHMWILSKVLIRLKGPREEEIFAHFSKYMIAMCCPKMLHRFRHRISQDYLRSLKEVKGFSYEPKPQKEDSQDISGIMNDRGFLENFVRLTETHPLILGKCKIPEIIKVLHNLPPKGEPFQLYTPTTCMEFHKLFLHLLEFLEKYLNELLAEKKKDSNIKDNLERVYLFGLALKIMVRGSAFQMHLKNIRGLLGNHDDVEEETLRPIPNMEKEDKDDTEYDEDLESVKHLPKAVWKMYYDWAQLLVVHFEAADSLYKYVTSTLFPYTSISIKILVAPAVDNAFLPWTELLTDSKLFPTSDGSSVTSNQEILNFFKDSRDALLTLDDFGADFTGMLHCEACLASLLDQGTRDAMAKDRKYEEILKETKGLGQVIGVSKCCCPICRTFLSLLLNDGKPFIIRGSHRTMSACTLPLWTPENIVNSMNQHFGTILRRELLRIMDNFQSKNRASSRDSQRLSIDSIEDWDWDTIYHAPSVSTAANAFQS